jgi:hypothetical protein
VSKFRGLENKPCPECKKTTAHRMISVQYFNPGTHWEQLFALCTSCLQLGRSPLKHIITQVYGRFADIWPQTGVETAVFTAISSSDGDTLGSIANHLRRSGWRTIEREIKTLLGRMVEESLIAVKSADRTELVLTRLRTMREKGRRTGQAVSCAGCAGALVSLYASSRKFGKQSKERVGTYCLNCGRAELSREKLLDPFDATVEHS